MTAGAAWLGLERVAESTWSLAVTPSVMSGASALYGGCATAAAMTVAAAIAPQPVVWASTHFGALARVGTTRHVAQPHDGRGPDRDPRRGRRRVR